MHAKKKKKKKRNKKKKYRLAVTTCCNIKEKELMMASEDDGSRIRDVIVDAVCFVFMPSFVQEVRAVLFGPDGVSGSVGLFAHLADCMLDVGEKIKDVSIGVDFDGFDVFAIRRARRAFRLDWAPRWRGFGPIA